MSEEKYPFIEFLEKHSEDRAMLAELRRGLGRESKESLGMILYVNPFIHNRPEDQNIYLIASLFALHPLSAAKGSMGNCLYEYAMIVDPEKGTDATSATTRRFVHLLRQSRDALDTPLRQHISMLKSKEIAVNWNQLLRDLHNWEHPDHFVQKQWATAYWKSK